MHSPDVASNRVRRTAERYYGVDGVRGVVDRLGGGATPPSQSRTIAVSTVADGKAAGRLWLPYGPGTAASMVASSTD